MRLAAAIAIALFFATAAVAATPPLPMTWQFFTPPGSNVRAIRFEGRLPARAAGERVTLLGRDCNSRFFRQLRLTRTVTGGRWETTVGGPYGTPNDMETGLTYRARWKDRWSVPFTLRVRINPSVVKAAEGRFRVIVSNWGPLQSFAGKPVVVQRATGSGWVEAQRARLRLVDARTFTATFAVPSRGLTLRALVPQATARPCFNAGASANFTS